MNPYADMRVRLDRFSILSALSLFGAALVAAMLI